MLPAFHYLVRGPFEDQTVKLCSDIGATTGLGEMMSLPGEGKGEDGRDNRPR